MHKLDKSYNKIQWDTRGPVFFLLIFGQDAKSTLCFVTHDSIKLFPYFNILPLKCLCLHSLPCNCTSANGIKDSSEEE